ncbi:MAG: hypothetical protein UX77_C0014G0004 [Parcubacteria group bacterium GW2011_GWA1_47_11]|nr:MAG: hypothetical protein UX77_C0014G0004 [Parcubacteria group bacterium GW2011_GWA1_47_11]
MLRKTALAVGETYHVYNRGAHKQSIFTSEGDYQRFLLLLHLCNQLGPLDFRRLLSKYKGRSFADIFEEEKNEQSLVEILAYSLMPNHFHVVLRQKDEGGITTFLKKVLTGYSMYFNTKYAHSGVLFQGRFKSSHIDNEAYFRYIFSYVHLNPLDLFAPGWKECGLKNPDGARQYVNSYKYSSFFDYVGNNRAEKALLSFGQTPEFLKSQNDLEELLKVFTKDRPLYGLGIV